MKSKKILIPEKLLVRKICVRGLFFGFTPVIGMIRYRKPLPAFGIPLFELLLFGFFFGSWAITEYYTPATFPVVSSMISRVFVMTGQLLIVATLILNYLVIFVTTRKHQSTPHNI